MALRIYNTLTRKKEEFRPLVPGKVGMYVCGPTVYKPSHIGHMVGPVIFDTVRRYLAYLGYEVNFVVNITDVDDKLIAAAQKQGTTVPELAERMTADYSDCLKQLGVEGITHMPRATEHIPEMLRMIQGLIDRGYAYPAAGDVYFDVSKDPDYGKLCNRDPDQLEAGARIEVSQHKKNPGDFALWKGAKPGEPAWESPWGPGRPGWHIECSAMSMKYLGVTLDIHGGGLDLQFPHHENELAQSESYTDQTFARYWMHNGLLKMGKSKMAGSVGNVLNVADVLRMVPGEVLRFFLLSTHYRSPIDLGDFDPARDKMPEGLAKASRTYEAFQRFAERYQLITRNSFFDLTAPARRGDFSGDGELLAEVGQLRQRFLDSMDDDFNTGGAVGVLHELVTALNRFADATQLEGSARTEDALEAFRQGSVVFRELTQLLGLLRCAPESAGGDDKLVEDLMKLVIDLRAEVRKAKQYPLADLIRSRLGEIGITLEDRAGGTTWRRGGS
jgi:cysteinyl-tRNA synthetase